MSPAGRVAVHAVLHPLRPDIAHAEVEEGASLLQILGADARPTVHVWVGGVMVPRSMWRHVRPKSGAVVTVKVLMGESGGDDNKVLRSVLQIAVIAASIYTAGLGGFGYNLLGAGISVLGSFAINALVPPQLPSAGENGNSFNRLRALTGTQNQFNPFGPVPRVYGRHRLFPPFAAKPYTEVLADDQFLRVLLCIGYGPLDVSDVRIGESPISSFSDVEYAVVSGGVPSSIYPRDVVEESLHLTMDEDGSALSRSTAVGALGISIDVLLPVGMLTWAGGHSDDFLTIPGTNQVASPTRIELLVEYREFGSSGAWSDAAAAQNLELSSSSIVLNGGSLYVFSTAFETIRAGIKWDVAPGQYDVRVTRVVTQGYIPLYIGNEPVLQDPTVWIDHPYVGSFGGTAVLYGGQMLLTHIRTIRAFTPLAPLVYLAMRIRATDQLSNSIDSINCIAESRLRVWNGFAFVEEASRNPAWVYLDVGTGSATERALDAQTRFYLDEIKDWADDCDANGRYYDAIIDARTTVFELMRDVAAVGRAAFDMRNGKYTVVRDLPDQPPVQHFTPRNSWGFSGQRTFLDRPHALRVRFVNPDKGWQQDERIVYDDGYDETNAERFEMLELRGVTGAEQAWRDGRYQLANARLRSERYTLNADVENLACRRGDLVRISHDVLRSGLAWGRLKAVAGDVLTLDEPVTMQAGVIYGMRIRKNDGSSALKSIITDAGEQTTVTLGTSEAGLNAGDLFMFGESGSESQACKVLRVTARPDFEATLELVDEAPGIYLSDTEVVPQFESGLPDPAAGLPAKPRMYLVRSDESVLLLASDGSLVSRIVVYYGFTSSALPAGATVETQYRTVDPGPWVQGPTVAAAGGSVSLLPVDDGRTYEIRQRTVSQTGAASAWTDINTHTVIGKTTPPPDVPNLFINGDALSWEYPNPPRDLAGFRVRHQSGVNLNWTNAIDAHAGLVSAPPLQLVNVPKGVRTLLVKAVDSAGFESVAAATVVVDLGDPLTQNLVIEVDYQDIDYPGTITNGSVVMGQIQADEEPSLFWEAADSDTFWNTDGATMFWGSTYLTLVYEFTFTPDADTVGPGSSLSCLPAVQAQSWVMEYRSYGSETFWSLDNSELFWGADSETFWAESAEEWRPWPGTLGGAQRQQYDFRITAAGGYQQAIIGSVPVIVDVADILENFGDLVLTADGIRLPIERDYRRIVNVNLTLQDDGGDARSVKIIDKNSALGPLVKAFDSAGSPTSASIDATVQGY